MAAKNVKTQRTEIEAAAWAALGKRAATEGDRDQLEEGATYSVHLTIEGEIDRRVFRETVAGLLLVNPDQERAKSCPASAAELVALLLGELSTERRAQLLERLPDEFLASGGKLTVDEDRQAEATRLLSRLATRVTETARGSVRFEPAE